MTINTGTYTDTTVYADNEDGAASSGTPGVWTVSPKLAYAAHFSGVAEDDLDVTAQLPGSDLSVNVYDIKPGGTGVLVSRTVTALGQGEQQVHLEMYGNDWQFAAGDQVGILVTSADSGWWSPLTETDGTVTVNKGSVVTLPSLKSQRDPSQDLQGYKSRPA